ncbi:phosphate/phosphite/phosphonate ABC transporter substrate-binding protein [Lacticaseibacillus mingshuiensis]|uniref:Phosphate/phosphite/phosphonate ABC transporter substrate-binding protein n=1 Tax=Lacticaseibacillus mingshuiensis TaxID=2799574 RepID=A0ABW4CLA5_9LACO|nr:phosphate/phosphite/phosphonate ABC transporter substrate-binding protein [Lacticaseibacillus mingshuiensis]
MTHASKTIFGLAALTLFSAGALTACSTKTAEADKAQDPLTMVFYPNESAKSFAGSRDELKRLLEKATGRTVKLQTTTDYNVAIQSLASGKAQIAFMGASGYIHAHALNDKVQPIAAISGPKGTLEGAAYNSYLMVPSAKAGQYKVGDSYSLDKLKGARFSFVSNTSTSGFVVPAAAIVKHFKLKDTHSLEKSGDFFSKVLYGGSHQGSAVNLMKGDVDVAAFDDVDLRPYLEVTKGDYNTAGSEFTVKKDAPEPFQGLAGKKATAISVLPVQREPWVLNTEKLDKATQAKIKDLLLTEEFADDEKLFSKPDAKTPMLFVKSTPETRLVSVDDAWYKPTHELIGK